VNHPPNRIEAEEQTSSADGALAIPLTEIGKPADQWTLTLCPDHVELKPEAGGEATGILRRELMKTVILAEGLNALLVNKPFKKNFKLDPADTARIASWIGLPVLAAGYLRRRYSWVLPVAIIWIIGSFPAPGDLEQGIEPQSFDPVGFALGGTLVLAWAFAKWRPHPMLFLVDSIWFLIMSIHLVMSVLDGWHKAWLLLLLPLLWMTVTGIKHFLRFNGVRMEAA
jgi:hypothetical protein